MIPSMIFSSYGASSGALGNTGSFKLFQKVPACDEYFGQLVSRILYTFSVSPLELYSGTPIAYVFA